MNKDSIYAFYGSLRRGMENYELYKDQLEYLYSARVKGFKLYLRGDYPIAVKASPENAITVEVFRITDDITRKAIHQLEMDEGYYFEDIRIGETVTGIYLCDDYENYNEVKGGDWVTFFRQKAD